MKNFKFYFVCGMFILLLCSSTVIAQFVGAGVFDIAYNTTINGRATGNDILDYGGDTYEVTVWDDGNTTNPEIGWNVYGGGGGPYSGRIPLGNTNAYDPDVVLVIDGNGKIEAVVVYFSGGTYYVESFIYNTGLNQFQSSTNASTGGGLLTFGQSVNIDADYITSDFIFVYDDGNSNALYAVTGNITSGSVALNNGGTPVGIGSQSGVGMFPDVYDQQFHR